MFISFIFIVLCIECEWSTCSADRPVLQMWDGWVLGILFEEVGWRHRQDLPSLSNGPFSWNHVRINSARSAQENVLLFFSGLLPCLPAPPPPTKKKGPLLNKGRVWVSGSQYFFCGGWLYFGRSSVEHRPGRSWTVGRTISKRSVFISSRTHGSVFVSPSSRRLYISSPLRCRRLLEAWKTPQPRGPAAPPLGLPS